MASIEWVFFDIDGTLLDHESAADAAVGALHAAYPDVLGRLAPEDVRARWRALQDHWFSQYLTGRLTFREQRAARVRGLWESLRVDPPADQDVDAIFAVYLAAYEAAWSPFSDVMPCLDRLDGLGAGVITNGDRDQQLKKLEGLGLHGRFEVMVASSELDISKPDPEIFHAAARRADAAPAQCIYVGDRLDTDAVAAVAAGMMGVWLDRLGATTEVPPTVARITSLEELTEMADKQAG